MDTSRSQNSKVSSVSVFHVRIFSSLHRMTAKAMKPRIMSSFATLLSSSVWALLSSQRRESQLQPNSHKTAKISM